MNPFERHFSPEELGKLWGYSRDTMIRWFRDEPGVLVHSTPSRKKRAYETIRIPESVAERVYRSRVRAA